MSRLFVLLFGLLVFTHFAGAQSAEEQYVRIYNLIQEADALRASGDDQSALPKYLEAQTGLKQIQRVNPTWQPKVVSYRLNYLATKITAVQETAPAAKLPPTTGTPDKKATPAVAPSAAPNDAAAQQLADLQNAVKQLQNEKLVLESKLKEALATQPATVDPRELAKAQEKVQTLSKENELLKAGLEQEKNRLAPAANVEAVAALRAENELLKKQLGEAKLLATNAPVGNSSETARKLAEAEARLAAVTSSAEVLRLEKIALESRLKQSLAPAPTAVAVKSATGSNSTDAARIKELERQRDSLYKLLEKRGREAQDAHAREQVAKIDQLTREVESLKSRLEVFETKAIPYSAEELSMFQHAQPKPALVPVQVASKVGTPTPTSTAAKPADSRKPVKELPAGTVALAAQAEKHFAAKQYDQAEENYQTILRQDENNAYTLANLAAIQMEQGRLAEAETNILRALAIAPEDPHANSLLGYLKFRQEKYDDAVVALNHAAKLNPLNADIQNYLGVTLSQKGLRGPAEQAFRKAIVLDSNHGGAQNNLAVFYAAENPPNVALARFHYQKALAAGHPRNAEIEALLEKRQPAPPAPAAP